MCNFEQLWALDLRWSAFICGKMFWLFWICLLLCVPSCPLWLRGFDFLKISGQIFPLYRIEQPAQCNPFLMRKPGERIDHDE